MGRGIPGGRNGIAALLDRLHANAVRMADGLGVISGIEILNTVDYTQVMFRLDSDHATRALGDAILADGTAAMTGAEWRGRAALRCSMSSWATTSDDIDRAVDAVRRLTRV